MDLRLPSALFTMQRVFFSAGFRVYLVGGAVRDMLMDIKPHDWDVATDAAPQDVIRLFRRTIPTGIKHGTVTVRLGGHSIETTTFRTEGKYTDGRHPDAWHKVASIEDDLARRDFTMNAVAVDLLKALHRPPDTSGRGAGECRPQPACRQEPVCRLQDALIDPYGGQDDIKARLIRAVGNPLERFGEDGLRPIRAIRFAAQTGFGIETETYNAISDKEVMQKAAGVSIERFRDELLKMLSSPAIASALEMLEKTGMRQVFLPDIEMDIASCNAAPRENISVRLAALFHLMGAKKARKVLSRLRLPNDISHKVCHLIAYCTFQYHSSLSDADVRRFLADAGKESVEDIFALHKAINPTDETDMLITSFRQRIARTPCDCLKISGLAINGGDIIKAGVPPGPEVGRVLNALFQAVLDDPALNTKEQLLNIAVGG